MAELDDTREDEYEKYNYDQDKYMPGGGSGKGRTRKEAEENTNRPDPGGHTRKGVQKLMNNHEKEKEQQLKASVGHGKETKAPSN